MWSKWLRNSAKYKPTFYILFNFPGGSYPWNILDYELLYLAYLCSMRWNSSSLNTADSGEWLNFYFQKCMVRPQVVIILSLEKKKKDPVAWQPLYLINYSILICVIKRCWNEIGPENWKDWLKFKDWNGRDCSWIQGKKEQCAKRLWHDEEA